MTFTGPSLPSDGMLSFTLSLRACWESGLEAELGGRAQEGGTPWGGVNSHQSSLYWAQPNGSQTLGGGRFCGDSSWDRASESGGGVGAVDAGLDCVQEVCLRAGAIVGAARPAAGNSLFERRVEVQLQHGRLDILSVLHFPPPGRGPDF